MASLSRRTMMTALATAPSTIGLAAAGTIDPVLTAIADWRLVKARYLAALEEVSRACDAANELAGPRPRIRFRGQDVDGVGEQFICRFFEPLDPSDSEVRKARAAALWASRDYLAVKREADRRAGVDAAEADSEHWCCKEADALKRAMTTEPTSVAGLGAVIRLMADEPGILTECIEEAMRSLAAAASALLPDHA